MEADPGRSLLVVPRLSRAGENAEMAERTIPDHKRIHALVAESEWLVADDRWTEQEFARIRAGIEAAGGDGAALQPLLDHADPTWIAD